MLYENKKYFTTTTTNTILQLDIFNYCSQLNGHFEVSPHCLQFPTTIIIIRMTTRDSVIKAKITNAPQ